MGIINDLDRGVMDRFLVSPARRGSLIAGPLGQLAVIVVIQALIIVGLALARGADLPGGAGGVAVTIGCSVLLAWAIGGLSSAIALVARKEETLIGAVNFLVLPLTFLSTAFMPGDRTPGWVGAVARYNPVNWAIEACRPTRTGPTWAPTPACWPWPPCCAGGSPPGPCGPTSGPSEREDVDLRGARSSSR